jgi:hypothetical protein
MGVHPRCVEEIGVGFGEEECWVVNDGSLRVQNDFDVEGVGIGVDLGVGGGWGLWGRVYE